MVAVHHAKKRFGQHFLTDFTVIDDIMGHLQLQPQDAVIEIGPGLGVLTRALLQALPRLIAIEIDRDLVQRLRSWSGLEVMAQDVLTVDFKALLSNLAPKKARIVGNLPYNISTPLLFHLFDVADSVQEQVFMLQKEVIDRMVAQPATAAYGRLSVMLQWRYDLSVLRVVSPNSFDPPPRVMSAIVIMQPKASPESVSRNTLETITRIAFSQRRKLLRHTLGHWLQQQGLEAAHLGFDVQRRAEEVTVYDYIMLAKKVELFNNSNNSNKLI